MALLLSVILILILIATCILFIPFRIGLYAEKKRDIIRTEINFSWPEKILRLKYTTPANEMQIYVLERKILAKTKEEKKEKETRSSKKKSSTPLKKDLIMPLLKLATEILKTFRLEMIHLEMDIGASDPGTTGTIAGYFYALKGMLQNSLHLPKRSYIRFQPHFNKELYNLKIRFIIKNQIKNFIGPALRFILKEPVQNHIRNTIFGR